MNSKVTVGINSKNAPMICKKAEKKRAGMRRAVWVFIDLPPGRFFYTLKKGTVTFYVRQIFMEG